jgi:hypothetical protein
MAGYSKRTLVDKLGLKAGMIARVIHAPSQYESLLQPIPPGVEFVHDETPADFIHCFLTECEVLEAEFAHYKASLKMSGMLWISWPKGSSKIPTDLNENIIRDIGLKNGLVDVKVCAVDEDWSGLKFVYRLVDRK